MAKVLLLHPKPMSAEAEIALRLIARRRDAAVQTLVDPHPLVVARALPGLRRNDATIIHAFGNAALAAAVMAGDRRIVFTPIDRPSRGQIGWLRAAMRYRSIDIVCSSDTLRRYYVTRGVPAERCHLIRPGVPMSLGGDRAALRQQLNLTDEDRLIFTPFEATHDSGHILAMWSGSLLNMLDRRYKLLVWGRGPAEQTIREFERRLVDPTMFRVGIDLDPAMPVQSFFAAADVVLLTGKDFGQPALTAMAMASGKPIVSTTTAAICEMIEDRHTAMLALEPTPRQVAQRVVDLYADDALRWKIADRARAEAYDYFAESRMLAAIDGLYGQASA